MIEVRVNVADCPFVSNRSVEYWIIMKLRERGIPIHDNGELVEGTLTRIEDKEYYWESVYRWTPTEELKPAEGPNLPNTEIDSHLTIQSMVNCSMCEDEIDAPCPKSKYKCGHHCSHSWSHDVCCWCGQKWGEQ